MQYFQNPWSKKEKNKNKASYHVKQMNERYPDEIDNAFNKSIVYGVQAKKPTVYKKKNNIPCIVSIDNILASDAIFKFKSKYENDKVAVLNFASYKNPGGQFLNGSMAQEEALCHDSTLYNVLVQFDDYYNWNRLNLNKALYKDRAIYSPDIIFMDKNRTFSVDVITCAAPNYGAASKYCHVSKKENDAVLKQRIDFVFSIAIENNVDRLILGAWGAGVFKQDPYTVANFFKDAITDYRYHFKEIFFAIPRGRNGNYDIFSNILM